MNAAAEPVAQSGRVAAEKSFGARDLAYGKPNRPATPKRSSTSARRTSAPTSSRATGNGSRRATRRPRRPTTMTPSSRSRKPRPPRCAPPDAGKATSPAVGYHPIPGTPRRPAAHSARGAGRTASALRARARNDWNAATSGSTAEFIRRGSVTAAGATPGCPRQRRATSSPRQCSRAPAPGTRTAAGRSDRG